VSFCSYLFFILRLLWKIEKISSNAQIMVINQLRNLNLSLGERFSVEVSKGTLDYLNSPVASTLLAKEEILSRKLEAWNEMKNNVFERLFTTVAYIPLVYLLNIIQLSVVSREKDLAERIPKRPNNIMTEVLAFVSVYLNLADSSYDFIEKKHNLRDDEIDMYFNLSNHFLQNSCFLLLIEVIQNASVSFFAQLNLDQKFSQVELADLFHDFVQKVIAQILTEKKFGKYFIDFISTDLGSRLYYLCKVLNPVLIF
jgi:Peroxin-3